ncbi:uncharacterized protein LOC142229384 [Haematobia irritans]|uniref:uncharacterized protein LOC142229384 n=1 Tax=Haematobia irritans TaxID=7368 RepID=UPI003F504EB2
MIQPICCQNKGNGEDSSIISYTNEMVYQHFKIENITVIKPPLLKIFYWQHMNIEGLNEKLQSNANRIEHDLYLPTRQLNSQPLKIVFWLRNLSKQPLTLHLRRMKNCPCVPLETRVGFNQFRFLYHCPHRRLINFSHESHDLKANDLVDLTMVAYFHLYGSFLLSYELSCSDSRVVILNFHVNIVTFDPVKSILTRELLPVNIKEYRRKSQAIWVHNITTQNLKFRFIARDRGFCLINSNMIVPRQSVWPLIVDYRPSDFRNELTLIMLFDGLQFEIPLTCKGVLDDEDVPPNDDAPINDYECNDFTYVIFPNKLNFSMELNDSRSLMVAVHNHNSNCREFKWQTYSINGYFIFTFEPKQFTLKPHHSKLCVVNCKTYDKPLHFRYLPAVLEIHRILDKSTKIAQQLLTEIESIDDPKWCEDSYLEHVFLQIDLKVNFAKRKEIVIEKVKENYPPMPLILPMGNTLQSPHNKSKQGDMTIFEIFFWEYLSKSSTFMRNNSKIPRNLTYEEVLQRERGSNTPTTSVDRIEIFTLISSILAESCRDLSKNYRFVPPDILETP